MKTMKNRLRSTTFLGFLGIGAVAAPDIVYANCAPVGDTFECSGWNWRQGLYYDTSVSSYLTYMSSANGGVHPYGSFPSPSGADIKIHILNGASVVNNGGGASSSSDALSNNGGGLVSSLYVLNDGAIIAYSLGGSNFAVELALAPAAYLGATTFDNNGLIQGYQAAFSVRSNALFTLNNSAAATVLADDIAASLDTNGTLINNYGTIKINNPTEAGNYAIGSWNALSEDILNLYSGSIIGDVYLAGADDSFSWYDGVFQGRFGLGDGSDGATVYTQNFDPSFSFDGGDDLSTADGMIDTLTFSGITATVTGANLTNWENVVVDGSLLSFSDNALTTGSDAGTGLLIQGGGTVDGGTAFALTGNGDVASDGAFVGMGGGSGAYSVTGVLVNDGVVNTKDGAVGDTLTVGSYSGSGSLLFDVDFQTDAADTLVVTGDVTGGITTIVVNAITATGTGNDVLMVDVTGSSPAGMFMLASSPLNVGGRLYSLEQIGRDWFLTSVCSDNQTVSGASGSVLGCVTPDTLTVTTGGVVTGDLEGAGETDMLLVDGDATVSGIVRGGGDGADMSSASDTGDLITINTTGSVGGVDGDLGDDQIWVLGGTVTGDVLGNVGDDRIVLNGATAVGTVDGGDGNDTINLLSGTANAVAGGAGNDLITLAGATVTNAITGGTGDDTFTWTSGTLGSFDGEIGSDTASVKSSSYDGSQKLGGGDDTSSADGFIDRLTLSGLTVTANGSNIVNWEVATVSGGQLTIADGAWSVGTAGEDGTGLYLMDGGNLEALDALKLDGNLSIASGSAFIGTGGGLGVYSVTGNVTNAGIITTGDGAVGDTFTVGGDYAGANGQLLVDVNFATASSDLLVIKGDVVGSPTVLVVNDVTSGSANGDDVLVVDVTGTTKAGDFMLAGGPITSGAYHYDLDLIGGGWYLATHYQPAASVYEVYPQALLALNGLPTLQQRVGNRYWRGGNLPAPTETVFCKDASQNFRCTVNGEKADYYAEKGGRGAATIEDQAIWGRIEASHSHVEPYRSMTGAEYDTDLWRLQAGLDGVLSESENGKLVGGVTAHYGRVFTDVSSAHGDGSLSTDGYGLGANLTWYGENGFYVDGQGQLTWYDSNLNSDRLGRLVKGNDATGYALSIEAGKRIGLGDWTVTPQAQLVYSSVDFDSFIGPNGELVSLDDGDSLRGRLGFSVERDHTWKGEDGDLRRTHLYGIANVYRHFGDGSTVMVSGTSLVSQADRWTGEIGIGGSYNWADDKYSVYGELSAATGFDNLADSYRFTGTVGLRLKW